MTIFNLGPEPNFMEILCWKPCHFLEFISAVIMFFSFALAEVSVLSSVPR